MTARFGQSHHQRQSQGLKPEPVYLLCGRAEAVP
jgi:hypothetical protein